MMAGKKTKSQFVLCVYNKEYPASLAVRKVYQVVPDPTAAARQFVRIIDESGEDYLYPESLFVPIELSIAAQEAIQTIGQHGMAQKVPDDESYAYREVIQRYNRKLCSARN